MGEKWPVKFSLTKYDFHVIVGFFNMPQNCDMRQAVYFLSEGRHA
jgi:hypothetical protein